MNTDDAVQALSALAYGARMEIYRLLVSAGEDGMPAGRIAEACGLSASTLSFHLNQLKGAGLVTNRRVGRSLIYSANKGLVDSLIAYLGDTQDSDTGLLPAAAATGWPPAPDGAQRGTGTMSDTIYNVLFLGDGNTGRSIMAEAILNREGRGRFRGFSAGVEPRGEVSGVAMALLQRMNYPTSALRSKPLQALADDRAPVMHFVFTMSDAATAADISMLPGQPLRADWAVPDPTAVVGTEAEIGIAYNEAFRMLYNRITILASLPIRALDRLSLQRRLDAIGRTTAEGDTDAETVGAA